MRQFTENNKKYTFNTLEFKEVCKNYVSIEAKKTGSRITLASLWDKLGSILNLSPEAVAAYYKNNNGPGTIDTVKTIAEFFETDYHKLLNEVINRKDNEMEKDMQKNYTEKNTQDNIMMLKMDSNKIICTEKEAIIDIYYSFVDELIKIKNLEFNNPNESSDEEMFYSETPIPQPEEYWKKLIKYRLLISAEIYAKIESVLSAYDFSLLGYINPFEASEEITEYYNKKYNRNLSTKDLYWNGETLPIWSESYNSIMIDYYTSQFQQAVGSLFI